MRTVTSHNLGLVFFFFFLNIEKETVGGKELLNQFSYSANPKLKEKCLSVDGPTLP